jgi:drug/metabolite transporter (DMT)-like permease
VSVETGPHPEAARAHVLRGRLLVIGAATLWGTSATLARYVFHNLQVPPLEVVEVRLVIAILVLAPILAWRRPDLLRIRREDLGYFLILGVFGVATVQATYYFTIARLGVGLAILLQYLAPSLVVLYELLRGRRVSGLVIASVVAATIGTALLVRGSGFAAVRARPLDWLIGLLSSVCFAFYLLYQKRGLEKYEPPTVLLVSFTVAAIVWGFVHPPWKILAAGHSPGLWWMFLALGLFSTLFPFSLFAMGLKRLPASEAGLLATFEPVVAVLTAWLVLHEGLRTSQWLGATLVLGAAVLATVTPPRPAVTRP